MQNIPDCLKGFSHDEGTNTLGFDRFSKGGVRVSINILGGYGLLQDATTKDFNSIAELEALLALPHDQFIEWVKSTTHFPQLLHTHGDRLFIRETGGLFKVQAIQLAWEAYNAKT